LLLYKPLILSFNQIEQSLRHSHGIFLINLQPLTLSNHLTHLIPSPFSISQHLCGYNYLLVQRTLLLNRFSKLIFKLIPHCLLILHVKLILFNCFSILSLCPLKILNYLIFYYHVSPKILVVLSRFLYHLFHFPYTVADRFLHIRVREKFPDKLFIDLQCLLKVFISLLQCGEFLLVIPLSQISWQNIFIAITLMMIHGLSLGLTCC